MQKSKTLLIATAIAASAGFAHAESITCGEQYTVRSGDFLSSIAKRAYGSTAEFGLIYSANAEAIGANPGLIKVGQRLNIPCLDGSLAESSADTDAIRRVEATDILPGPAEDRPIRVLTATGWAPYTDQDQEQGGMITELVNLALENAAGSPDYQIDFINDWSAHLSPLLSDHAYDFSIGWVRPDCSLGTALEEESQFRCNNLDWSEPLYQDITGYYTRADTPQYMQHADLIGQTFCRPIGYTVSMLEEVGLTEDKITYVRLPQPADCLQSVLSGEADVALFSTDVIDGLIANANAEGKLQMHEPLSAVNSLYAVIAKTHPDGEELIATLNSGLQEIKDSGLWFATVRRHMNAFRESNVGS